MKINKKNNTMIRLASTSPYRKELLERLTIVFSTHDPKINEDNINLANPKDRAQQLALTKAKSIANQFPNDWIIGSDQVACLNNKILSKPGTQENAIKQLKACANNTVAFFTAVALINQSKNIHDCLVDATFVVFRDLNDVEINQYLQLDQPFNCAGSFKVEKLGIMLFEKVETQDPTALIGLPLIALNKLLLKQNINILLKQ